MEKGADSQVVQLVRDSASAATRQLATKARKQVVNSLEKKLNSILTTDIGDPSSLLSRRKATSMTGAAETPCKIKN